MTSETEKEEIVWHYTNMESFIKIFPPEESKEYEKEKIKLRFTNCRFTNDPLEALAFKNLIQKNRDKISNSLKEKFPNEKFNYDIKDESSCFVDSYIFSATNLCDSMAFWGKDYAGTTGIAIGFNKNFCNVFKKVIYSDDINEKNIEYLTSLVNKSYQEYNNVKNDVISNLSKRVPEMENYMSSNYGDFCPLDEFMNLFSYVFKSKSWEHESEMRIILKNIPEDLYKNKLFYETFKKNNTYKEAKSVGINPFKWLGGDLKPKIESVGNKIRKVCYKTYNKNIVSRIMLGPDCKAEHIDAIEFHLITNNYDEIEVSRSHAFDLRDK